MEAHADAFSGGLKSGDRCINPPVVDPPSQLRHSPSSSSSSSSFPSSSSSSSLIPLPSPYTPFPQGSLLPLSPPLSGNRHFWRRNESRSHFHLIARVFRCSLEVTDPGASTLESGQPLIIVVGVRSTWYLSTEAGALRDNAFPQGEIGPPQFLHPINSSRETRYYQRKDQFNRSFLLFKDVTLRSAIR